MLGSKDNVIDCIYAHMADDFSKEMFGKRLMYSLTSDSFWVEKIITMSTMGKEFYNTVKEKGINKRKVIFGAGDWGKWIANSFPHIKWTGFADSNKAGQKIAGLPVESFDTLIEKKQNTVAIISSRLYYKEMEEQLLANGFLKENIVNAGYMTDQMGRMAYFDLPALKHSDIEIFVDGGCFDGETSLAFHNWKGGGKVVFGLLNRIERT